MQMKRERIDTTHGVDMDSVTFEDLAFLVGTGIAIVKGTGRNKETSYRNGVSTRIGDIEAHIWRQLMEQLIDRSGEGWLLKALEDWYRKHSAFPSKSGDLHGYALELHSVRIFEDEEWVDYIPFNREYRPEHMEVRKFPIVHFHCCCDGDVVGEVTEARLKQGNAPCPVCGRFCEIDTPPPGKEGGTSSMEESSG